MFFAFFLSEQSVLNIWKKEDIVYDCVENHLHLGVSHSLEFFFSADLGYLSRDLHVANSLQ